MMMMVFFGIGVFGVGGGDSHGIVEL